eukprot:TRINITY_DN50_c0_g1_i1.p1 TRINITY_DN50_c0_g1~~TRINITY_DN50_c0_g1_i1.p1  ORF type:complete len:323 (-),score=50.89 TRINITY_DN50_c0_g1_i1:147-1115(-)
MGKIHFFCLLMSQQDAIISTLTQRIEHLEKAYAAALQGNTQGGRQQLGTPMTLANTPFQRQTSPLPKGFIPQVNPFIGAPITLMASPLPAVPPHRGPQFVSPLTSTSQQTSGVQQSAVQQQLPPASILSPPRLTAPDHHRRGTKRPKGILEIPVNPDEVRVKVQLKKYRPNPEHPDLVNESFETIYEFIPDVVPPPQHAYNVSQGPMMLPIAEIIPRKEQKKHHRHKHHAAPVSGHLHAQNPAHPPPPAPHHPPEQYEPYEQGHYNDLHHPGEYPAPSQGLAPPSPPPGGYRAYPGQGEHPLQGLPPPTHSRHSEPHETPLH